MLLRNHSARLVTINHIVGGVTKNIQIKPGKNPAVEVPDELVKKDTFVKALLTEGILRKEVEPYVEDDEDDDAGELASLQAEAIELGMDFKDTWALSTLKGKIAAFKKASAE